MKIRTGLVSNSSSSSFLLVFDAESAPAKAAAYDEYIVDLMRTGCYETVEEAIEGDYGAYYVKGKVDAGEKFIIISAPYGCEEMVENLTEMLGAKKGEFLPT